MRGREHVFRAEQSRQGESGRDLRAVDERQAFFRPQLRRSETRAGQAFLGRENSAADAHLADAEQRRAQVRERRQVARGAHRPLRGDQGIHLVLEQREQRSDQARGNAGVAARQRIDLEGEDQAHHRIGERLADAGGVREQ